MKTKVKEDRGFTSVDITIAMLVIIIFVSISTSLMYSVYVSQTEARRTATALNYAVDVFEAIGTMQYSEVTKSNVINKLGKVDNSYTIDIDINDNEYPNEIKLITLRITYKTSSKDTQTLELQRVKVNS